MTVRELRNIRWAVVTGLFAGFYFGLVFWWSGAKVDWWAPLLWIGAWAVVEFGLYHLDRKLSKRLKAEQMAEKAYVHPE